MKTGKKQPNLKKRLKAGLLLACLLPFAFDLNSAALATKNSTPDRFTPSPLELPSADDPLLPRTPRDRQRNPLTDAEKTELKAALEALNTEAAAKLQAGDGVGAFEIWYRELRLRRYLGAIPEVEALGRVGAIAWEQNRREDVQSITKRLQEIQKQAQAKPPVALELWRSLGTAYQQLKAPRLAAPAYEPILAAARQQQDRAAEEATLRTIGDLSLSWFNYGRAAAAYRELLQMAQEKGDRLQQIAELKQLAYIYDQGKQYQLAIATKEKLAELFLNEQDFIQIPALQLSIGANYEAQGLLEQAAQNYQEAYAFAYQRQMYSRAADALQKLAGLFESTNQIDKALEVYEILLDVAQLASDYFIEMDTYDRIGRLYLTRNDYAKALEAFQNGLEMAKDLKYREAYFAQRIEQVTKRSDR